MAPTSGAHGFRVELLGPVEAWVDGTRVALGGPQPRTLLAVLALAGGRVVASERLIDELWGGAPPATARESLKMHVSRLRRAFTEAGGDSERLVSRAGGYALELDRGARDLDRWESALAAARRARADGRLEAAGIAIAEALGVWRGDPLGGARTHELLGGERARLEEERLAATILGIEIDLEQGRHAELIGRLEALVIEHPFQERLVALQMLALYRCGRQADALAAFQAARGRFVDELGIEPTQPLRDLHEDVLRHSAELSCPAPASRTAPLGPSGLRSAGVPVPPNRTIGREHDIAAISERLRGRRARLVTLTGPGGVGKTRLALEATRAVQADFADGAHFVSLAALGRPEDVPAAIVEALGIVVLPGDPVDQAAERFFAAKHLLLVIDNLEQLLAAAPFIGGLLAGCPALTILVTSREPLMLQAEERYPVSPLPTATDAVALFCDRAQAREPGFALRDDNAQAIAEICRRVDGLPLAIELAAARCGLLSPAEIADRLELALGAPGAGARDAPARQQTLGATIDWSHELLSDAEQRCFARLAVFAGGATVEAAETITGGGLDTLEGLVSKSLVTRRHDVAGATRLGMLETIRAYAGERFAAAADAEAAREEHYRYYLALAQRHGTDRALRSTGSREHFARLDADIDNLHAALGWAVAQPTAARAVAMAAALGPYWLMRQRYADGLEWVERALTLPLADADPALHVGLLCTKLRCLWPLGRLAEQPAVLDAAEQIARRLGDPVVLSRVLRHLSQHELEADRLDAADAFAEEAIQFGRAAGDDWEIAEAFTAKAIAASTIVDLRRRVEGAAGLLADVGNVYGLTHLLTDAAYCALCLGSERDATDFATRAGPMIDALGNPVVRMVNSGNLGMATLLSGDADTALGAFREELTICREALVRPHAFEGLSGMAALAVLDGDGERAATLVGAAGAHRYDMPVDPVEERVRREFFEPARAGYGTDVWDAAARAGGALSFEDAIAYALGEPCEEARRLTDDDARRGRTSAEAASGRGDLPSSTTRPSSPPSRGPASSP